ncbi:ATP-binding protein [Microscilla marina]|uniref:Helicase HerA central domain-containing protein n=1 Tax=Microscilla marina ATCC 23134 TaxID=313606 RepID=A1ZJV9_MICM2|nr:DUF87 domain-containing protein [Microscilla marina]EAY29412.1 conserved hypothetical protein [Microscilla marina ATCC 23134]
MSIVNAIQGDIDFNKENEVKQRFEKLIQINQYIGDLYSINYETAKVVVHDYHRQQVGGIPSLCFLIATRVDPTSDNIDFKDEDSSFILLRVMDSAHLPQDKEAERIRVETAQRISGETNTNWDEEGAMDYRTRRLLGFAGIQCRIIGTFYFEEDQRNSEAPLSLKFGSDISNYYPNQGLKVYKPNSKALEEIINYCDSSTLRSHIEKYKNSERVRLGQVRYASTNRKYQKIDDVPVYIYPADLLSQKSALFGMTRTGKSNTTKIIAKSVFELRKTSNSEDKPLRIGQIIFDPNGEYANENSQDSDGNDNPNALKNIWEQLPNSTKSDEVVTYGITPHPNDPDRNLMLLNFFTDDNLQTGKSIIGSVLSDDSATYIKNFLQVIFEKPDVNDRRALTRYNRRVLAYRSVLARAGFAIPQNIRPNTTRLFNANLIAALQNYQGDNAAEYQSAAQTFGNTSPTWGQLANAFEALDKFMRERNSGYNDFETTYVNRPNGSGERWADDNFKKIIGVFQYPNGTRKIGKAAEQHSADTRLDYSEEIYKHLVKGKLVIIDQSSGEPDLNKSSAERIMWYIFRENQKAFRNGDNPPEILVYVEEAHNILPAGSDLDTSDVWVRTAKEGAKYKIGMVYATQEVSSIQKNILKNTANWFISHLNNTDETKELCKYYDFADFEPSIRRAQDKGFLRVKTLSNLFVIPVQVKLFQVNQRKS